MSGAESLYSMRSMDCFDKDNPYNRPMDVMSVHAEGPNLSKSQTFRNNYLTSSNMSCDFRGQWGGAGDQRSIYERETSPTSLRSMPNFHSKYKQHHYPREMESSRSTIYRRNISPPISIRSTASNASDIASAMRKGKFDKQELKIINEAYLEYIRPLLMMTKRSWSSKIHKRYKLKVYNMSGARQESKESDDSSDSNDCMSTVTGLSTLHSSQRYKRDPRQNFHNNRSKTVMQLRKAMMDSSMYRDCSNDLRHNGLRNIIPADPQFQNGIIQTEATIIQNHEDRSIVQRGLNNGSPQQNNEDIQNEVLNKSISCNNPSLTQKNRFENSALYKSSIGMVQKHRFGNVSNTRSALDYNTLVDNNTTNSEKADIQNKTLYNASFAPKSTFSTGFLPYQRFKKPVNNVHSKEDEIFSEITIQSLKDQGKRHYDTNDTLDMNNGKKKKTSPKKDNPKVETNDVKNENFKNSNDFEFVVPNQPIRKCNQKPIETLISRSKHHSAKTKQQDSLQTQENKENVSNQSEISLSEVSTRPSFMKRKLFTQKLDVLDEANTGPVREDSSNSKIYNNLLTEKNKTKKLVKNQSCLSRDVNENEDLMDLLHKIVPRDDINITHCNSVRQKKSVESKDKCDIFSITSNHNEESGSETFTDEDISYKYDNTVKVQGENKLSTKCTAVPLSKATDMRNGSVINKSLRSRIETFWDTDFESDIECVETHRTTGHQHGSKGNSIEKNLLKKTKETSQAVESPKRHMAYSNGESSVRSKGSNLKTTNVTVTKDNKTLNRVKNPIGQKVRSDNNKTAIEKKIVNSNKAQNSITRRNNSTLNTETNASVNVTTTALNETKSNKSKRKVQTTPKANKRNTEIEKTENTGKNKNIGPKRNRLKLDIDNSGNQTNDSMGEIKNNKSEAPKKPAVKKVDGRKTKTIKNDETKIFKDTSIASDHINNSTRTLRYRKDSKFDSPLNFTLNSVKNDTIRRSCRKNRKGMKQCSTCSSCEYTKTIHKYELRPKRVDMSKFFDSFDTSIHKMTLRHSKSKNESSLDECVCNNSRME